MAKKITSKAEIDKYFRLISDFPVIHNTLKADFVLLMDSMVQHEADHKVASFYRSLLSSFYSMVEADLFYYNQFDPYTGYKDRHTFLPKFKQTFEQICKTWDKEKVLKEYYLADQEAIFDLKKVRNKLIHPEGLKDIALNNDEEIEKVLSCYNLYTVFISEIMQNFMFDIQGETVSATIELGKYLAQKLDESKIKGL